MIIGLTGITFNSVNFGVSALAYSQISLIDNCAKEIKISPTFYIFSMDNQVEVKKICDKLGINEVYVYESARFKPGIVGLVHLRKRIAECEVIFDLTKGDSFSDIYGYKRYILQSFEKWFSVHKSKLVISPQTIGPFNDKLSEIFAKYFLQKSLAVYARDSKSQQCVNILCPYVETIVTSDLAFLLPFKKMEKKNIDGKIHIGINISGLLWNGGYSGKNEFRLKCDYQTFTRKLIEVLENNDYKVYLIAHVYMENGDDDFKVCKILAQEFKSVILAPRFESPIEAKSFFSCLDVLIGARMHATIGAISSGIVTIPISYSRKFEGLYDSIDYPYVIEAMQWDTHYCLEKTMEYIKNYKQIIPIAENAVSNALAKNGVYRDGIKTVLEILR